MIISASRRTDIPKFFSEWFIKRIQKGFCTCINPFNRNQVTRISLLEKDVDAFVFWTKDPKPLISHIPAIDNLGHRFYFQFTLNDYPKMLEPNVPPLPEIIETFRSLSELLGPERVIWRYDPIILSSITPVSYHLDRFEQLVELLKGKTAKVVTSIVDDYKGSGMRMNAMHEVKAISPELQTNIGLQSLLRRMVEVSANAGMEIESCGEQRDLEPFGIRQGKCVDSTLIAKLFGVRARAEKDPSQRPGCGCVISRDIGVYGTCRHDCVYCYARNASSKHEPHLPDSPSLVGWHEAAEKTDRQCKLFTDL